MGGRLGGGEAHRAGQHRLDDQVPHAAHLGPRRPSLGRLVAQHVEPKRRVADHGADVEALGAAVQGGEVVREGLEGPRDTGLQRLERHALDVLQRAGDEVAMLGPGRRDPEPAVPRDDGRDPVPAGGGQIRVPEHLGVEVGMDINKPGGKDQPVEIHHRRSTHARLAGLPYRDDPAPVESDVRHPTQRTGAIHDLRPSQQHHGTLASVRRDTHPAALSSGVLSGGVTELGQSVRDHGLAAA